MYREKNYMIGLVGKETADLLSRWRMFSKKCKNESEIQLKKEV